MFIYRTKRLQKFLYYFPRIFAIAFIVLLMTYAWGETDKIYYVYSKLLAGLFRKLITPLIMLFILGLAWRWEIFGGIIFFIFSGIYFIFQWDISYYLQWGHLTVGFTNVFIGLMFIISYQRPMDTYD